jgi:hypothetical protein
MPSSQKQFIQITLLLLLAACTSPEQKALAPYATATLTPGVGLGNLELGKTTLGWVAENIGAERVAVLAGDEVGLEPRYLNGQLSLLFIVSGECQEQTGAPLTRVEIKNGITAFLSAYPACKELTLSSLSVGGGEKGFFKGGTDKAVNLGSPLLSVLQHGVPVENAGRFVAGEGTTNLERVEFPNGIYFYYDAGEQPTAREIMSGQPLSPERQEELKASAEEASKNIVVKRMTIFMPDEE